MSRIVVTGLGVISSIGIGKDRFWDALLQGKSGISEITSFDTSSFPTHKGGEIKDFSSETYIDQTKIKTLSRTSALSLAASKLALEDAGVSLKSLNLDKTGVILGTTMGESQVFERINEPWIKKGESAINPELIPACLTNRISLNIALYFGFKGPNYVIPTACSAGNYAIGYSFDLLKLNKAEVMLAGGADSFSKMAFTGFNRLLAVAPSKCQPFDKNRKGMMVGEGAAVIVLESLERAINRKANIYAEVLGYALSCDAHHMTAPNADGIASCMEKAIKEAGIKKSDVDYISAHGTGTPANDKTECAALAKVFGSEIKNIPTSSIKSMLGHTMGAASAIEAACCCMIAKHNIIPPTINYETPDPECDIDCVPNTARKKEVGVILNNAYAFGGNNAVLVLRKFQP